MNKHAQQGEKDTKASGLKMLFEISNTNKCREKKRHQIKLQVSRSCLRSQTRTNAERKRTPN